MKPSFFMAILAFTFLIICAHSAYAQITQPQNFDGKTIIPSSYGDLVCFGNWDADSRTCNGPQISSGGLSALSAMKSTDTLEQIRALLDTMNRTLSVNTEAILNIQKSFDPQSRQANASLHESIDKRFDAIPENVLTDDSVKEEFRKLREDILREIDQRNVKPPAAPPK